MTDHDLEFYREIAKQRLEMREILQEILAEIPSSQELDGSSFVDLTAEQIERIAILGA
jgi:hypothetical protein